MNEHQPQQLVGYPADFIERLFEYLKTRNAPWVESNEWIAGLVQLRVPNVAPVKPRPVRNRQPKP